MCAYSWHLKNICMATFAIQYFYYYPIQMAIIIFLWYTDLKNLFLISKWMGEELVTLFINNWIFLWSESTLASSDRVIRHDLKIQEFINPLLNKLSEFESNYGVCICTTKIRKHCKSGLCTFPLKTQPAVGL